MVQLSFSFVSLLPFLSLLTLSSQVSTALATTTPLKLNDWSVPCFQGRCAYDLPEADNSSTSGGSGSLQIVRCSFSDSSIRYNTVS